MRAATWIPYVVFGSSSINVVSQGFLSTCSISLQLGWPTAWYFILYPWKPILNGMSVQFHFTKMIELPVATALIILGTISGAKNNRNKLLKIMYSS